MDYDESLNISTLDENDEMSSMISRRYLTQEIIFTIFMFFGIWADIAIIYTMFKFRRMRSVSNIFLTNWAVADLLCLIVTPSTYRIISVLRHISLSHEFLCLIEEYGATLHITVLVFVLVVTLDWFIGAYFGGASEKFQSHYRIVSGSVWLFAIMWSNTFSALCMSSAFVYIHQSFLLIIWYCAILLLVIVCHTSRIIQKCRKRPTDHPTLILTLATAFITSSFLSFLTMFLHFTVEHQVFGILSTCLLFSNSITNLTLLYFFDNDFHSCFKQVLRRSDRYEETVPEFGNPIRNTNDETSDKVSFHNSREALANDEEVFVI